jgi:hypothetical protein
MEKVFHQSIASLVSLLMVRSRLVRRTPGFVVIHQSEEKMQQLIHAGEQKLTGLTWLLQGQTPNGTACVG